MKFFTTSSRLSSITSLLCAGLLAVVFASSLRAASIVRVTYTKGGELLASMIYSGRDGGPGSDPAPYWALVAKSPEIISKVKIKADKPGGKVATLKGKIKVSLTIRNQFNMGTAETDTLTLVRDDADSDRWYLSKKEHKRIAALAMKKEKRK